MLLQHSNAWTLAVQATFQRGRPFSQVPAMGWFAVMAQLSIQKLHHTTRCTADSLPASQPVSQSYYLGISHTAWSQCLSSLHISSAEVFAIGNDNHMQRYCRMHFSNPLGDAWLVGRVEGRKVLSWHIKPEWLLQSFMCSTNILLFFPFFLFLFVYIYHLSVIFICTCECVIHYGGLLMYAQMLICLLRVFAPLLFPPPRAMPA